MEERVPARKSPTRVTRGGRARAAMTAEASATSRRSQRIFGLVRAT